MKKIYVLGGAQTDFSRNWTKEGKGLLAILREVVTDGIANCKMDYDEIERLKKENKIVCVVSNFNAEQFLHQGFVCGFIGLVDKSFQNVPCYTVESACASGSSAIDIAMSKIVAGECEVAICIGVEVMKTVDSKQCAKILGAGAYAEFEANDVEYPFPTLYSKLLDATIKKYDLDEKILLNDLAKISYNNYCNAKHNPLAQTRKWLNSFQDILDRGTTSNPIIAGKLASRDCSQITDGGAVVILASEKYAKEHGYSCPIIKAKSCSFAPILLSEKLRQNDGYKNVLPYTKQCCDMAYVRSGLSINDIDTFEIHDCFTITEYIALSCLGLCEEGKEHELINGKRLTLGGDKPINASGGLIGCGHPIGATGERMMLDLFKQVSNSAGDYQVKNVKNAMMLNIGGTGTTNYCYIIGQDEK